MSMLLLLSDDGPNPRSLFALGEQGFWYDPSDFSTMFQDAAGTTPVTAVGQSVRRINDKSGRGNHATQSTALSRPTLQQDSTGRYYLSFDGTDDGMVTPSINFTGTDKMTVWAGVRKNADASTGTLLELSAQSTGAVNPGSFGIFAPRSAAAAEYSFLLCGSAVTSYSATSFAAPITNVLSVAYDIAGAARADEVKPRVNSAIPTLTGADSANAGTGNFGNYPLYIGRRGGASLPFGGRIYQLIGRGAATPLAQIQAMEQYVNAKTGAY